jgi:DNA polymerase III alpha subunit (gram-positive type)
MEDAVPTAPDFQSLQTYEVELARKYFASLPGRELKSDGLVYANGVSCAVCPSVPEHDGAYRIPFNNGRIGGTDKWPKFVAIVDPTNDDVLIVSADQVLSAIQNQTSAQSVAWVSHDGVLVANAAWIRHIAAKVSSIPGYGKHRVKHLTQPEDFVHLHVHSMYSFLDGVSTPEGLVAKAKNNGQPGMALTDHGMGFGLIKFYQAARYAGITPILGIEFYIVHSLDGYCDEGGTRRRHEFHQTVLAMDNVGYENLNILASKATRDGWHYVPRITYDDLARHNEGLILLSGCFKGLFSWHLQKHEDREGAKLLDPSGKPLYRYDPGESRRWLRGMKGVFGDRLYVEAMNIPSFDRYNLAIPEMLDMANSEQVPVVCTNDCHYEQSEDAAMQAVLSRISKDDGSSGERLFVEKGVHYVKCRHEMQSSLFDASMFDRTCQIMERCRGLRIPLEGDEDFKFFFPTYPINDDEDYGDYVTVTQQKAVA